MVLLEFLSYLNFKKLKPPNTNFKITQQEFVTVNLRPLFPIFR